MLLIRSPHDIRSCGMSDRSFYNSRLLNSAESGVSSLRISQFAAQIQAVLITCFVLADLVFRPKFVNIYAGSEEMSRASPVLLSVTHLIINVLMPACMLLQVMFVRTDFRRSKWIGVISGALIIATIASIFANPDSKSLIYIIVLAVTLGGSVLWVAVEPAKCGLQTMLQWTAGGHIIALLLALFTNEYLSGRLSSRAGPNYWGMTAFTAAMLALSWNQRIPRYLCIAVAVLVVVLAQARGSLVGMVIGGSCYLLLRFIHSGSRYRGWYLAGLGALLPVLPLLAPIFADKVMLVSSSGRGGASGGSGRLDAWGQALNAFMTHPFFGVGYRQHESYITVASNAHNTYLAILAELGLGGLIAYLFLVIGGVWRAGTLAVRHDSRLYAAMFCFLAGFTVIGLVEYQGLATGSPMPLLMIIIASHAWAMQPRQEKLTSEPAWRRQRT